jgi:Zn-dependent M16 (insulinase) family peptidase
VRVGAFSRVDDFDHLLNVIKLTVTRPRFDNVADVATHMRRVCRTRTQNLSDEMWWHMNTLARSKLRPLGALQEEMLGLTRLRKWTQIIQSGEFEQFAGILSSVTETVIKQGRMRLLAYVGNSEVRERLIPQLTAFVHEFNRDRSPLVQTVPEAWKAAVRESAQVPKVFLQGDTKSNHCLQVFPIGSVSSPLNPLLFCLAEILQFDYLHDLLRIELGAYGAMSSREARNGVFFIRSYRDPNGRGALAAFAKAFQQAGDKIGLSDQVIESAVIRIFSRLDKPLAPQQRGKRYWRGCSRENLRRNREICYNLTKEQVTETARRVAEIEPVTIVFSSQTIAPAPDGFTIVPLNFA